MVNGKDIEQLAGLEGVLTVHGTRSSHLRHPFSSGVRVAYAPNSADFPYLTLVSGEIGVLFPLSCGHGTTATSGGLQESSCSWGIPGLPEDLVCCQEMPGQGRHLILGLHQTQANSKGLCH